MCSNCFWHVELRQTNIERGEKLKEINAIKCWYQNIAFMVILMVIKYKLVIFCLYYTWILCVVYVSLYYGAVLSALNTEHFFGKNCLHEVIYNIFIHLYVHEYLSIIFLERICRFVLEVHVSNDFFLCLLTNLSFLFFRKQFYWLIWCAWWIFKEVF